MLVCKQSDQRVPQKLAPPPPKTSTHSTNSCHHPPPKPSPQNQSSFIRYCGGMSTCARVLFGRQATVSNHNGLRTLYHHSNTTSHGTPAKITAAWIRAFPKNIPRLFRCKNNPFWISEHFSSQICMLINRFKSVRIHEQKMELLKSGIHTLLAQLNRLCCSLLPVSLCDRSSATWTSTRWRRGSSV